MVAFPLPLSARVTHALVVENLRALGFVRVLADGRELHLDELPDGRRPHRAPASCWWWWTACGWTRRSAARLADSLQTAFSEGEGEAVVVPVGGAPLRFTRALPLPGAPGDRLRRRPPRSSSPSTTRTAPAPSAPASGRCSATTPPLVVPNPRALAAARGRWTPGASRATRARRQQAGGASRAARASRWTTPGRSSRRPSASAVLHGAPRLPGRAPFLEALEEKRYKQYIRVFLRQYQSAQTARVCGGAKLRPEALRVRVAGRDHRRGVAASR